MPIEVKMWLKAGQIQVKELVFDGKRCCPFALTKHHLVSDKVGRFSSYGNRFSTKSADLVFSRCFTRWGFVLFTRLDLVLTPFDPIF